MTHSQVNSRDLSPTLARQREVCHLPAENEARPKAQEPSKLRDSASGTGPGSSTCVFQKKWGEDTPVLQASMVTHDAIMTAMEHSAQGPLG